MTIDEFRLIVLPLKSFVEFLTGIEFIFEPGYGYINLENGVGIEKGCIGINYMIAIFYMMCFSLFSLPIGQRKKLLFMCVINVFSYLYMWDKDIVRDRVL